MKVPQQVIMTVAFVITVACTVSASPSPAARQAGRSGSTEPSRAPGDLQPGVIVPSAQKPGRILRSAAESLEMLRAMNKARAAATARRPTRGSTRPFRWDPLLARAALVHSQDMARNNYLGHVGTRGDSPCDRLAQSGVRWQAMGENLARSSTVAEAEKAFMNEPDEKSNHRSNILNPDFNYVGVGIARGKDGMIYITQEFAKEP